jgi:hypothetical protein
MMVIKAQADYELHNQTLGSEYSPLWLVVFSLEGSNQELLSEMNEPPSWIMVTTWDARGAHAARARDARSASVIGGKACRHKQVNSAIVAIAGLLYSYVNRRYRINYRPLSLLWV